MSKRSEGISAGETVAEQFLIPVKGGKLHPGYAGVLDLATRLGLVSLKTRVIQIPAPENEGLAVVMAEATFDDETVWSDVGDCSPRSTSPQIAVAALRMASTRAKSRVLRDACCVTQQTLEEADGEHAAGAPSAPAYAPTAPSGPRTPVRGGPPTCVYPECGVILSQRELGISRKAVGQNFCPAHLPRAEKALSHELATKPAV